VYSFIDGAAAADLKIGFTLSLTGGTDDYGKAARMGAELALKEYNDKGGYKGQKVEAVIYDDETKPAKGVENVTRLITRDKVFAIVGPVNSGVALAIIDIAQKNQIPLMDTIATAEQIIERYQNAPKSYIFRVSLNDGIQTSIMLNYINARKYQRIGLMHDLTGLQNVHTISDVECAVKILFDQKDRKSLRFEIAHDPFQMLHHDRREAFRRLVHQDHLRIDHQRAADREHAALAAG